MTITQTHAFANTGTLRNHYRWYSLFAGSISHNWSPRKAKHRGFSPELEPRPSLRPLLPTSPPTPLCGPGARVWNHLTIVSELLLTIFQGRCATSSRCPRGLTHDQEAENEEAENEEAENEEVENQEVSWNRFGVKAGWHSNQSQYDSATDFEGFQDLLDDTTAEDNADTESAATAAAKSTASKSDAVTESNVDSESAAAAAAKSAASKSDAAPLRTEDKGETSPSELRAARREKQKATRTPTKTFRGHDRGGLGRSGSGSLGYLPTPRSNWSNAGPSVY
ncbi:hypothetical protein FNYG_05915 [Fusarium nygamai]|uniref:Uncharacterized protein n=1 Tax=Gibberella nygamai TaxID=42673 RepID=A0A2K0WET5_GIBNY|nr:hypothetical protein FNYG_05915 [Fusarium nygamai]